MQAGSRVAFKGVPAYFDPNFSPTNCLSFAFGKMPKFDLKDARTVRKRRID